MCQAERAVTVAFTKAENLGLYRVWFDQPPVPSKRAAELDYGAKVFAAWRRNLKGSLVLNIP